MLAFLILIQNHWFEFLVLVVDVLDEYDFIIGLESIIQLEATYYLTSHILTIEPKSIPLYPYKNILILPKMSTMIQLIGDLPCDFSSGTAIIRVKPIIETFSYITLAAEFINQILQIKLFTFHPKLL